MLFFFSHRFTSQAINNISSHSSLHKLESFINDREFSVYEINVTFSKKLLVLIFHSIFAIKHTHAFLNRLKSSKIFVYIYKMFSQGWVWKHLK